MSLLAVFAGVLAGVSLVGFWMAAKGAETKTVRVKSTDYNQR